MGKSGQKGQLAWVSQVNNRRENIDPVAHCRLSIDRARPSKVREADDENGIRELKRVQNEGICEKLVAFQKLRLTVFLEYRLEGWTGMPPGFKQETGNENCEFRKTETMSKGQARHLAMLTLLMTKIPFSSSRFRISMGLAVVEDSCLWTKFLWKEREWRKLEKKRTSQKAHHSEKHGSAKESKGAKEAIRRPKASLDVISISKHLSRRGRFAVHFDNLLMDSPDL